MAEPPVCAGCGGRHWFLDPCGTREVPFEGAAQQPSGLAASLGPLAATASADEIERALKLYRRKREASRLRMRRKRSAAIPG